MTTNKQDTGLSLELDTQEDDTAFEEAALDEELDDSMAAAPVQMPRRKSKAKLLAGLLVVGVLGAGGFFAYQSMMANGGMPQAAAVPADVPADPMAAADPLTPPGTVPDAAAMDPFGAPVDPNAPPADVAADGSVVPVPPTAPDAVMADGGLPPAEPMPGFDPMAPDAGIPADPMAAFTQPADAGMPAPQPIDPVTGAPVTADAAVGAEATTGIDPNAPVPPADQMAADASITAPADPAVMPTETPPVSVVTEAVVQAAPVVPTAMVEPPAAMMMREQIVTLENRVAELETELKTLRDRPAPAPVVETSGISEADFEALKRRVEELAAAPKAKAAPAPAPVPVAPAVSAPVATAPMPPSQQVVPATVRAVTRVEQATGGGRAATTNPSVAPSRASAPTMGVNWQLRSAQPGRAWIAQPGTQEMRSIAVGDEVPGLGRILSIAQGPDGRWVVRGALGSVNQ